MNLKPVFIIGAGRSGTKFLRDTLAASPEVARIPYDVGYVWRYGNESLSHDQIAPDSVPDVSLRWMRRKLPDLVDRDEAKPNAKILVEKSVPNSLRPALLHRAFPDAIFIHLVRDGRAVTESAMRMWQKPPERGYLLDKIRYFPWSNVRYAVWYIWNQLSGIFRKSPPIWGPRYPGIETDVEKGPLHVVCAKQWLHCVSVASEQLSGLPSGQVFSVRYEDLMAGPGALEGICKQIGIDPDPVLKRYNQTLNSGNNEKWRQALSSGEIEDVEAIFEPLPADLRDWIFCEKTP